MKIKSFVALLIGIVVCPLFANAQLSNSDAEMQRKINDAVMNVYKEELEKNPNDYATLFSRANQYFINGEYLKALDDVTQALKYTTVDDRATLYDEYMLRAKIYNIRHDVDAAIADLKEANKLDPANMSGVLMLGDLSLEKGDTETAKFCYQELLRTNSIDYNALAGMAKVSVFEKNYGKASEYANKAVELYPAEENVYLNRADVLVMMNDYKGAAQDIISALSVSKNTADALNRLVDMSDTNYDAVIQALSNSIDKAPKVGMFYYIRSMVAMRHNHYGDALKDLNSIIAGNLYNYHGIYYDAAVANFNLGHYKDALSRVNSAIAMYATNTKYYVLKSQVLTRLENLSEANAAIVKATNVNANDIDALRQKALLSIQAGKYRDALSAINEAILNNPTIPENLLLRAWIEKNFLKSDNAARSDFSKMLTLGGDLSSLRGLALHGMGKDLEAKAWADEMVHNSQIAGGECYYVAAIVYAQCGDTDKALDMLESALANGYASYYNIADYASSFDNIAPVRTSERFATIMTQYKSAFQ